jgi:hypothetical protein
MAMNYNPNTDPTRPTAPPPPEPARTRRTWTYVALGVLVLAIVAIFAIPDQAGDSVTSGAPSVLTDPSFIALVLHPFTIAGDT